MGDQLDEQVLGAIAVMAVLLVLLLVWILRIGSRLKKLRKLYTTAMNGNGVDGLEGVLTELQTRLHAQEDRNRQLSEMVARLAEALSRVKGHVGVNRYAAFAEQGSDLSFSVAIVDQSRDGVVLSGIHTREETYVYAKPLQQGNSSYALTPEEREAISRAVPPQSGDGRSG